jgi:hypothetical protein
MFHETTVYRVNVGLVRVGSRSKRNISVHTTYRNIIFRCVCRTACMHACMNRQTWKRAETIGLRDAVRCHVYVHEMQYQFFYLVYPCTQTKFLFIEVSFNIMYYLNICIILHGTWCRFWVQFANKISFSGIITTLNWFQHKCNQFNCWKCNFKACFFMIFIYYLFINTLP